MELTQEDVVYHPPLRFHKFPAAVFSLAQHTSISGRINPKMSGPIAWQDGLLQKNPRILSNNKRIRY